MSGHGDYLLIKEDLYWFRAVQQQQHSLQNQDAEIGAFSGLHIWDLFPLKTIILGNRFLWRAEIKLMWFLWVFPCNERKPMVLCCLVPGQERGPSWSGTRVMSCCAFSQGETACSPCGTLGQAVHTALTTIRTQWPVSAGLAELPEPPQHLLGACRDSLPLHFLFFLLFPC